MNNNSYTGLDGYLCIYEGKRKKFSASASSLANILLSEEKKKKENSS